MPAVVDQAAYRIAGEALANAAAHGPAGGRVDVRVGVRDDARALELEVLSELPAGARAGADARPGLRSATGLETMRERARSTGGDVVAGPDEGRWRVHAVLPLAAAEVAR
jgi:signal transduction histidine kinase